MKLIKIVWLPYLSLLGLVCAGEIITDYGDDTVELEAFNDEVETTTLSGQETTFLPKEQERQEAEDGECITNNGFPGSCESVQECFPRLFPIDPDDDDTPKRSGSYNQNLVKILIESSGFCGSGIPTNYQYDLSNVRKLQICCKTSRRSTDEYPLDQNNGTQVDNNSTDVDDGDAKRSCGSIKIDPKILPNLEKIVGGREAVLGEFPWMVAMLRRGQQFCGGSLIDDRNVLTAAHCVEFMTKQDVAALRLHIGDLDIYSGKETSHVERKAKKVLYHKGFTMKNLAHDIAIVQLDRPVTFSETIQPVCLHTGNPAYDTGKSDGDVAGWGTTSSGGSQSSKLLAVRIRVITNQDCNQKYAKANKMVGPGMVCAGSPGKDSCQGDSGGPLVVGSRTQGRQIGIVSWGIGCATYPGVYTRVDKYMKWVNKNKQK